MVYSYEQQRFTVPWLIVSDNATESQRQFTLKFGLHPPERKTIKRWKEKIHASGSLVSNQKGQGRPFLPRVTKM